MNSPKPKSPPRRGVAAKVAVLVLVAATAFGGFAYSRHRSGITELEARRGEVLWEGAVRSGTSPVSLRKLPAAEIPEYRLTATIYNFYDGRMNPGGENTVVQRVESNSAGEHIRLAGRLVAQKAYGPGGVEVPAAALPPNPLMEKTVTIAIGERGNLEAITPPDGQQLDGGALMTALLTTVMEPNRLTTTATVNPGDSWKRQFVGTFPGMPGAAYEFRQDIRFEGMAEREGRSFARCSFRGTSIIRDLVLNKSTNPKYSTEFKLIERRVEAIGDVYVDPETSLVHHVVLEGEIRQRNQETLTYPGRSEPFVRPESGNHFPFRNEFHVEYAT